MTSFPTTEPRLDWLSAFYLVSMQTNPFRVSAMHLRLMLLCLVGVLCGLTVLQSNVLL